MTIAASSYAAWCGAVVASFLAAVKVWELRRDRFRLSATYSFASRADIGNKVLIINASPVPAIIIAWELAWSRHRYIFRNLDEPTTYSDGDLNPMIVAGRSVETLTFSEENYFVVKSRPAGKPRHLLLKLHLGGRGRAVWLHVHTVAKLPPNYNRALV